MPSVNENIRDRIIAQDVTLRKAGAAVNNAVQARMARMRRDLKALMVDIDPGAVSGARQRDRLDKLRRKSSGIIRVAMAECAAITRRDAARIAKSAADMVVQAVRDAVP